MDDFTLENEFIKIKWIVPVDLRSVNIDKSVKLSWRCVEMYPEEVDGIFIKIEKPEFGEKLNQPAII